MAALAVWTPQDALLGAVAPLALAASAGTALVIDLDVDGPRYRGRPLARLVEDGPRRDDLRPRRRGLAVLANGGIEPDDAADVVSALVDGWPNVVLRLSPREGPESRWAPTVPVRLAVPGDLLGTWTGPAVWQPVGWRSRPRPGVTLPRPRPSAWSALLAGRLPPDPWIRAWRRVWSMRWA